MGNMYIVLFGSIFIGWSLRPCQGSGYKAACGSNKHCSAPGTLCVDGFCFCGAVSYWNANAHRCEPKVPLGGFCPTTDACITNNSVCSANRRCECYTPHYQQVDGKCKIDLGYACVTTSECADNNTQCTSDSPLSTKVCTCDTSTHYDTNHAGNRGGDCERKSGLGEPCPFREACLTPHSVCSGNKCLCSAPMYHQVNSTCKLDLGYACVAASECADNNTQCTSDSPLSTKVCTCDTSTHYDTNHAGNRGGDCERKSGLGERCPFREACLTPHSVCSGNTCKCAAPTYQQVHSTCKLDLGYACTTTADCADHGATCAGESRAVCTCNADTYYDDNGIANRGGACKQRLPIVG